MSGAVDGGGLFGYLIDGILSGKGDIDDCNDDTREMRDMISYEEGLSKL